MLAIQPASHNGGNELALRQQQDLVKWKTISRIENLERSQLRYASRVRRMLTVGVPASVSHGKETRGSVAKFAA